MNREIKGKFGVIEGTYKKEASISATLEACQHYILEQNRKLKSNIVLAIHGNENGEHRITEHEVGSSVK